jgi:hypothetical protein
MQVVLPCFAWEWVLLLVSYKSATNNPHASLVDTSDVAQTRRIQAHQARGESGKHKITRKAQNSAHMGTGDRGRNGCNDEHQEKGSILAAYAVALALTALIICSTAREAEPSTATTVSSISSAVQLLTRHVDAALASGAAPLKPLLDASVRIPGLRGTSVAQLLLRCLFVGFPGLALQCRCSWGPHGLLPRLLAVLVGFAGPFAILSNAWEGLFVLAFSLTMLMYAWLVMHYVSEGSQQSSCSGALLEAERMGSNSRADTGPGSAHAADLSGSITWMRTRHQADLDAAPPRQVYPFREHKQAAAKSDEVGQTFDAFGANEHFQSQTLSERRQTELNTMAHMWAATVAIVGVNLAFFGTGNMASVASFEPASVLRLMTCAHTLFANFCTGLC